MSPRWYALQSVPPIVACAALIWLAIALHGSQVAIDQLRDQNRLLSSALTDIRGDTEAKAREFRAVAKRIDAAIERKNRMIRAVMFRYGWTEPQIDGIADGTIDPKTFAQPRLPMILERLRTP